jgi:hypothetical protein
MNNFKLLRGYENERRVFHIDVGNMNPEEVERDIEYFRQQIIQASRIPVEYFRREMLNEPDIFIPVRNNDNRPI